MNRKTIAKLLACATAFAAALPLLAITETETVGGIDWTYTISDGKAAIDNNWKAAIPPSTSGAIIIPATLGGYPVTSIERSAFCYCSGLTSVTIPDSVTSIGMSAFSGCSGLTSVTIPDSVTSIGEGAFGGCRGLTSVTIPASVTNIGNGAFSNCRGLTSVTIPDGVTRIGDSTFYYCIGLTSVTIPASVTSIGEHAFSWCHGLTSVTIPASVTSIGTYAFYNCSGLTSVTFKGNAPTAISSLMFDEVPANCTAYVSRSSTGWGVNIPGTWNGIRIAYAIEQHPVVPPTPGPTPDPKPVTPGHEVIETSDVVDPYEAPKAVTLAGAVYDGNDLVGLVELKLGKVSKGKSKVSGAVTTLDGKKHAAKAVNVTEIDGTSPKAVSLDVKDLGKMEIAIGGTQFAGSLGGYHVQAADVGGNWTRTDAKVYVDVTGASLPAGTVAELLPVGEPVLAKGGKWAFNKAASVKLLKDKSMAEWDTAKGKTNLSAMKLSYTPKTGLFKGSFKVYALEGAKLKKYTANVTGVVVDGVGYGQAAIKRPAAGPWAVTVE